MVQKKKTHPVPEERKKRREKKKKEEENKITSRRELSNVNEHPPIEGVSFSTVYARMSRKFQSTTSIHLADRQTDRQTDGRIHWWEYLLTYLPSALSLLSLFTSPASIACMRTA